MKTSPPWRKRLRLGVAHGGRSDLVVGREISRSALIDGSTGALVLRQATEAHTRAPASSAAERAQGRVVQDRVAALRVGDLLEGLIQQVQGAAAIIAVQDKGTLAVAGHVLRGKLDGQGIDPGGVGERLDSRLPVGPRGESHGPLAPDGGLGVSDCESPLAQTDASQPATAQGVTLVGGQAQRLFEVAQGQLECVGEMVRPAAQVQDPAPLGRQSIRRELREPG